MSARFRLLVSSVVVCAQSAAAQTPLPRHLLTGSLTQQQLAASLVSADAWHPYPTIRERAAWDAVPPAVRAAYVRAAEEQRGADWGSLPATMSLQFVRDGVRANYDRLNTARRKRLADLVMAEVFENRGRFLDEIANGIWAISEQSFWGSMAHMSLQKAGVGLADVEEPVVDLFAAEAAAMLAWTDYLLGTKLDSVSPRLRPRIRYEVQRRVLTPALERDDFWWMGFGPRKNVNNWNPWINSNWLASVLILERDPDRRARAAHKIARSVDNFLDIYPPDGGCDEGPGYWDRAGGSLFDNLELLHQATNGRIDVFGDSLVRNIGRYIHRAYIANEWYVNTGDAAARLRPDAELIYRYGVRIDDPALRGFGAFLRRQEGSFTADGSTLGRIIPGVLTTATVAAATPIEPLPDHVWLPDLQLMAARSTPGTTRGFYLAALGAHNGQSHNHNDVGNFVVFADGKPVLIDVGVEVYSARTFGPLRYSVWTMQSAYHNLPTINGTMQKDGAQFRADQVRFATDRDGARFSLDIAKAYPDSAAVKSWQRTLTLRRGRNEVELLDAYALDRFVEPVRLNLMTSLVPETSVPGEVHLRESGSTRHYVLRYDPAKFAASAEEIPIRDARLGPIWGTRLARVVLTARGRALRDEYRILIRDANTGAGP